MKVVIALDTCSASKAVLETAVNRPWPAKTYFEVVSVSEPDFAWTAQGRATRVVAEAIAQIHGLHYDVGGAVLSGDPKKILLDRVRDLRADMLMAGCCADLSPGSDCPKATLLRHAPCSVELVRFTKPGAGGMKILLATDGSSSSELAAISIAERPWPPGTQVRIVSVPEILPLMRTPSEGARFDSAFVDSVRAEAMLRSERAVARAREILTPWGGAVTESIATHDEPPNAFLLQEAQNSGADLIVLGARGVGSCRSPVGSVAEAVAMYAECSVQVIR